MKSIFFISILFLLSSHAHAQLWVDDFSDESDGDQSGTAGGTLGGTWSVAADPGGTFEKDNIPIVGEGFLAQALDGEGIWETNTVNIASVGYAIINIDVFSAFVESNDYVRISYVLDGSEVVFYELIGGNGFAGFSAESPASAIVAGSTLQVRIYVRNDDGFIFDDAYAFDNVTITAAPVIYSRGSGDWTNTSNWSLIDHSGSSCTCYPLNTQVVRIGAGHTVTLSSNQTNTGTPPTTNLAPGAVDVYGVLQYTNGVTLGIEQGLLRVRNGGIINSSGAITGEQISFNADVGGAALQVDGGGSVTVDDLVLTSNATNFHYLTGSGSLAISRNITISASNASLTNNLSTPLSVGGTVTVSQGSSSFVNNGTATLSNTAAGTLAGSGEWIQGTSSTLNYAGSTMTIGTLDASATGNLVNYNANGAQTIEAPSGNTYYHLTLQGSNTKTSSSNLDINGNLTIAGSAQLDVDTGNDNINLAGHWNNSSSNGDSFLQGAESVTFDGSTAQIITPPAGGESFYNLRFNNNSGSSPEITLNGNVTVTNVLTMSDGNVNLNGNTLAMTSSASGALVHGLSSASGWMYGGTISRLRPASTTITVGASAHSLFPLGSASDWRPFFVGQNSTAATAGTMTVTHTNSTSTSDVTFPESISRRHNSYWTPRTTATGGTYTLRAGGTNFGTITSNTHIRMSTSTGVTGTHAAGSGGPTDWMVNRTGVTLANFNANNFHVASANSGSPLPIELLSFSAQLKNNFVELKWSTASETDNDFFTIERSNNIEHFEPVLEHDGAGTTKELNEYRIVDPAPLYGRSYYRLKQTDFDGKFTYSPVRTVDYQGPEHATLTAFPNPSSGKDLSVRIEGIANAGLIPIQIFNMQGQKVYEKTIEVTNPGVITEEVSRDRILPSGLYLIKAGNTLYLQQKIVIK